MDENNFSYYARRASEQVRLARQAGSMRTARLHYKLVRDYTRLALKAQRMP